MLKIVFKYCCVFLLIFISVNVSSQVKQKDVIDKAPKLIVNKKPIPRKQLKEKSFDRELNFGAKIASDGWGIDCQRWQQNMDFDGELWQGYYFSVNSVHHPRQIVVQSKLPNPQKDNGPNKLSYVYGKVNYLAPMHLGYAIRKKIGNKLENNHIKISGLAKGGVSLGWTVPYYLQIAQADSSGGFKSVDEKYSESNAVRFLDQRFVYGSSGFSKGLSEVSLVPGIHSGGAIQFEYKTNKKNNLLLEIGGNLDLYIQKILILAKTNNQYFYPNIYVAMKKGFIWQSKKSNN